MDFLGKLSSSLNVKENNRLGIKVLPSCMISMPQPSFSSNMVNFLITPISISAGVCKLKGHNGPLFSSEDWEKCCGFMGKAIWSENYMFGVYFSPFQSFYFCGSIRVVSLTFRLTRHLRFKKLTKAADWQKTNDGTGKVRELKGKIAKMRFNTTPSLPNQLFFRAIHLR